MKFKTFFMEDFMSRVKSQILEEIQFKNAPNITHEIV